MLAAWAAVQTAEALAQALTPVSPPVAVITGSIAYCIYGLVSARHGGLRTVTAQTLTRRVCTSLYN